MEPAILAEMWNWDIGPYPNRPQSPVLRAIYQDRWKLIQTKNETDELYDLIADPTESRNLLETELEAASARAAAMTADLPELSVGSADIPRPREVTDPALMERLRALGYVQ